jgi:imidazolonepropionase-like amidohydrolase
MRVWRADNIASAAAARSGPVAPGALADLLVVDGEPESSLDFLADPEQNLRLIIKGGQIAEQTL